MLDCNANQNVIFVNQNTDNSVQDGSSWQTAFSDLQSALELAESLGGATILVAAGTYIPSQIYSPRNQQEIPQPGGRAAVDDPSLATNINMNTFNLPDRTSLIGGFAGTETQFCQRDSE